MTTTVAQGLAEVRLEALLAEGNWATLYTASLAPSESLVIKMYERRVLQQEEARRQAMTERLVLEVLEHLPSPFIVRMLMAVEDVSHLYIGMQLVDGQDLLMLLERRGPMTGTAARFYAAEIALALGHLHSHDFVYRNLKPEHVLLSLDGHAMLCDLSRVHHMPGRDGAIAPPDGDMELVGLPEYFAPELVHGHACCENVDWWSLGCITCEMLTGLTPFVLDDGDDDIRALFARIIRADIDHLQHRQFVGPVEFDVLCQLVEPEPERRLGARPLGYRGVLAHPWFDGLTEDALLRKLVAPPYAATQNIHSAALAVPEEVVAAHAAGAELGVIHDSVDDLLRLPQPFAYWSFQSELQPAPLPDELQPTPLPDELQPEEQAPAQEVARDEAPKAEEQVASLVSPVSVLDTSEHRLADGASKPAPCVGWEARRCA